ncbi:MAG TPA: hypothetical protein VMH22_06305 [bacterium]|nr:hypothetical protein [bacterium]
MTTDGGTERDSMSRADTKKWSAPRLTVFVKTKMDERVLANCKHSYPAFSGPEGRNNICTVYTSCIGRCST